MGNARARARAQARRLGRRAHALRVRDGVGVSAPEDPGLSLHGGGGRRRRDRGRTPTKTFGTPELADAAAAALAERNACLLEHHGVLALRKDPGEGARARREVENLARQYVLVRGLGEPRLIESDEMRRVIEKFRTYGMQPAEGDAAVIPAKPQEPSPRALVCIGSRPSPARKKVRIL